MAVVRHPSGSLSSDMQPESCTLDAERLTDRSEPVPLILIWPVSGHGAMPSCADDTLYQNWWLKGHGSLEVDMATQLVLSTIDALEKILVCQ